MKEWRFILINYRAVRQEWKKITAGLPACRANRVLDEQIQIRQGTATRTLYFSTTELKLVKAAIKHTRTDHDVTMIYIYHIFFFGLQRAKKKTNSCSTST
jgi:hypothetical protein